MGDFNVAEAEVIMLEIVDPDIAKVFEESTILWNMMAKGEAKFTNSRGVRLVTYVQPNPGMSWYSEGGLLPVGSTSRKIDMRVFYTRFAISGSLTGDAIDTTSRESLLEGLSSRISEDTVTGTKEFNQQAYEDGSGIKASVTGVGSAASGILNFAATGSNSIPFGARRLLERGKYNFINTTTGAVITSGTGGASTNFFVTAKSNGSGTGTFAITEGGAGTDLTAGTAIAAGNAVVYSGSYNRAIHGLRYHVNDDTGVYQGQSRATYPTLKSPVIDASSAALSVSLLDKLEFQTMYRAGADVSTDDFMIVSSPTQAHAYRLLGYNLKRFTGDKFDGGYKTITHNGHMWILDTDCYDNDLFMLRTKTWGKYQVRPFGIMRQNGQVLNFVPAFDTSGVGTFAEKYVYYIGGKCDLGCKQPQMNARLKNLSTSNVATGIFG